MTGPDSDNELEAFLARRSLIHRRFAEGEHSEPPAELDRIVLTKAREAIKRPGETPLYRSPQWALPVGLAASFLLVFAVVLNFVHVTNQPGNAAATMANQTAAPQVSTDSDIRVGEETAPAAPALADEKVEAKAEADAALPPALASKDARLMKQSAGADRREREEQPVFARAPKASEPARDASGASAEGSGLTAETRPSEGLTAGGPAGKKDSATGTQGYLAGTGAISGVISKRNETDATVSNAASPASELPAPEPAQPAMSGATSDSALLASNAPPKPAEQAARSDESKETHTASTNAVPSSNTLEETVVTGARRVRGGKRPAVPNAPAAIAMEKAKHPNPDQWLREIDVLRTAGRIEEADRELEMFRRAYPDHPTSSGPAKSPPPAQ